MVVERVLENENPDQARAAGSHASVDGRRNEREIGHPARS